MTAADDFWALLLATRDSNGDLQTIGVFADWLQDRGDPRAEGFRALYVLRLWPRRLDAGTPSRVSWYDAFYYKDNLIHTSSNLPSGWFADVIGGFAGTTLRGNVARRTWWSVREALEAAVDAWARLPREYRDELLATRAGP